MTDLVETLDMEGRGWGRVPIYIVVTDLVETLVKWQNLCNICRIYTCEIILKTKSKVELNVQFRVLI